MAGPLPRGSQLLWSAALAQGSRLTLLEVFCGALRPGSLLDATAAAGGVVAGIDILIGGESHDVGDAVVFDAIYAFVASGLVRHLWLGVVCSSFSQLWLQEGRPRLRSRAQPDGIDPMPIQFRGYICRANLLVERVAALAICQHGLGLSYYIENPADVGFFMSPHFRWSKRAHVPVWLTSWMRRLALVTNPTWGTTELGGWDSPFRKLTTICAGGPDVDWVRSINLVMDTRSRPALAAVGVDGDGRQLSQLAGRYPPLFAAYFAHNFLHPDDRWPAPIAAAVTPVALRLLSIINAQLAGMGEPPTSASAPPSAAAPASAPVVDDNWPASQPQGSEPSAAEPATSSSTSDEVARAPSLVAAEPPVTAHPSQPDARPRPPPPDAMQLTYLSTEMATLVNCGWRSAHGAIPQHWPEHEDVTGELYQQVRCEPLPFISRRRAEAADPEELATRPMPQPTVTPQTAACHSYAPTPWPLGCPPRPIHVSQLYYPGVYDSILKDIDEAVAACQVGEAGGIVPRTPRHAYTPEASQPSWARECPWDADNPEDCVPLQPTIDEPPAQGASPEFFKTWGEKLNWGDKDMIHMVSATAIEDRSSCTRATIIQGHHGGLRRNFLPAHESIEADRERGFMTRGRRDLRVVPSIMVPKNCVRRRQWKLRDGELQRTTKWRVTTDDSLSVEGETSRNESLWEQGWTRAGLPNPRTLAELVAITKSCCEEMRLDASQFELERIALWAFDLSHAYRELASQRIEQGRACFIWVDGVSLDLRCVFGTAHMVDTFQRITTFVLAVGKHRIREYEEQHPYTSPRKAWHEWRRDHCGFDEGCGQSIVYIDDGLGLTVLEPGAPLTGRLDFDTKPTHTRLGVEPGGSIKLDCFVNLSRAQVDLAIMIYTFREAGWGIAADKVQLGLSIDELGMHCSSEGDGCLSVPEAKRLGMLQEIQEQLFPTSADGSVPFEDVDGLVGRCLHIAMAAVEANPYLQPMYAMKEAKRLVRQGRGKPAMRISPTNLSVHGDKPKQRAYQDSLAWWQHALEAGITVPLAPRLTFPELGEPGVAFMFTDAAREDGTGHGGFTFIEVTDGQTLFLYTDPRWPDDIKHALQQNSCSMPAGEGLGAVIFADQLADSIPGLTHMVIFTDSSAVAAAIQSNGSPSPQMNFIVRWLFDRHPSVQFLALHQPGCRNIASDGLSRTASATILAEASAAGATLVHLPPQPHATDLMYQASALPQRPRSHHPSQP